MSIQRIAGRYAKSLLELAQEQKKLDRIVKDVESFSQVAENRDFELMLKSPIVTADKKLGVINALFDGKYDELTMAFLRILVNKGREPYLADIAKEFIAEYKRLNHISAVKVTTAAPMTDKALAQLKKKLEASSVTDQTVEIETAVDKNLIGGFVLEIGDKIYDASVAQKLEALKRQFQ